MSYLKVIAIGNLGRDPELRYTGQGQPICSFSIAASEKRKDRNGDMREVTTWMRVTFWGKQAETANQYLRRGSRVYIEGRARLDEYTDRDGKQRQSLEINGTELQFLTPREENGSSAPRQENRAAQPQQQKKTSMPAGNYDDDIPF